MKIKVFKVPALIFFISIMFVISGCVQEKDKAGFSYDQGNLVAKWNQKLTETIVQDLFNPPVASRIYAYSNIAAYEVLRFTDSNYKSLVGPLNGFEKMPQPKENINYNYTIAAMTAFTAVGKKLTYTEKVLEDYRKGFLDSMASTSMDKDIIDSSVSFGMQVADAVIAYSVKDNFKKTRGDVRYVLLGTPESWQPTPPDYMTAAEPHWEEIRPFVLPEASCFLPDSIRAFSIDKKSDFYKEAYDVYMAGKQIDSNQRSMAIFWDDNPNVSTYLGHLTVFKQKMTPGGHWMAIISKVVKDKNLDMIQASQAYSLTAVAIADAFISCWNAKYKFGTIRPITYINKYIDDKWQPVIQTPPFPEFPSGHSTLSAAAATVLTNLFGDNYAFTDSSEVPYGLPVRSFKSFYEASDEAALSRFYGGIHFKSGNEAGKEIGKKVGNLVVEKLLKKNG